MNEYSDDREVYGFLNSPINSIINEQGKVEKGLITVIFERVNGELKLINTENEFDKREEVFLVDGFEALKEKHQQYLVKFNAVLNNKQERDNDTKYVTFKNVITPVNKAEICSFINYSLPEPLGLEVSFATMPHTKIFYLVDDGYAYGPFSFNRSSLNYTEDTNDNGYTGKLKPMVGKLNGFPSINEGMLLKIDFASIQHQCGEKIVEKDGVFYLTDPSQIHKANKKQIDFLTQDNIHSFIQYILKKKVITKLAANLIKKELTNHKNLGPSSKITIEKVISRASDSHEDWRNDLFDVLENHDTGKELISKAVEQRHERYEKQWLEKTKINNQKIVKESETKKKELDSITQSISNKNRELIKLEQDIAKKLEKLEQESGFNEELAHKRVAADDELQKKRTELEVLETQYKEIKSYDNLKIKLKELRDDIRSEMRREHELETTLNNLRKEIAKSDESLQNRLRDMAPYVSSIIQAPMPSKKAKIQLLTQEIQPEVEINTKLASNVVNGICTQFSKTHNRDYSSSLVASILVAHFQNLLTIFSGPPGLGKTSFVRLLADVIGQGDRFKEIAVGRSWTSEREFIGFYNSLTENFSPAPSGLYQYLKGVEEDNTATTSPKTILLDEANLSPLEHYAAILLNVADGESSRHIPLGKDTVKLASDLRVIGTVNHDMTTEPLSARLLDRAPVIPFEVGFDSEDIEFEEIDHPLNYSSQVYMALFGCQSKIADSLDSTDVISKIINILNDTKPEWGIPFVVSKRKYTNITRYVAVLTPVLEASCGLDYEAALTLATDYAVLYFLLPPITGNGGGVQSRLKALSSLLSDRSLDKSLSKLDDMLKRGAYQLDTFNFFNY